MMGRAFPGKTWRQWNDHYRDTVRDFVRGQEGLVPALMARLYGSTDLLPDTKMEAFQRYQSVNYVDSHDGLNMYDLVSYKNDGQYSWNCGYEGGEGVPAEVAGLRRQQVKNFCCLLTLSNGTPMFVAGDEFMHTQNGNANPWGQDNETTWLDWALAEKNADVLRFFQMMIVFRKAHPVIGRGTGWGSDVSWHGVATVPDLATNSHSIAFYLRGRASGDTDIYVMINAYWGDLVFTIEAPGPWLRIVDTSLASPDDIIEPEAALAVHDARYAVAARSIVVLISGGPECCLDHFRQPVTDQKRQSFMQLLYGEVLELGEGVLDWVDVRTIGRQASQLSPRSLDQCAHLQSLVVGQIVHSIRIRRLLPYRSRHSLSSPKKFGFFAICPKRPRVHLL